MFDMFCYCIRLSIRGAVALAKGVGVWGVCTLCFCTSTVWRPLIPTTTHTSPPPPPLVRILPGAHPSPRSRTLQIPLFGIMSSDSSDPLYWIRVILASNRGAPFCRPLLYLCGNKMWRNTPLQWMCVCHSSSTVQLWGYCLSQARGFVAWGLFASHCGLHLFPTGIHGK